MALTTVIYRHPEIEVWLEFYHHNYPILKGVNYCTLPWLVQRLTHWTVYISSCPVQTITLIHTLSPLFLSSQTLSSSLHKTQFHHNNYILLCLNNLTVVKTIKLIVLPVVIVMSVAVFVIVKDCVFRISAYCVNTGCCSIAGQPEYVINDCHGDRW